MIHSSISSELTCEEEVNNEYMKFSAILNEFHGVGLFSNGKK